MPVQEPPAPSPGPPTGCQAGTVAITHRPSQPDTTAVCLKTGARLRLTLTAEGEGGWTPFQITPHAAATVTSSADAAGNVHATVSPAGTTAFCLSTATTSDTAPSESWQLCVTIQP
jgi:hypothetical protein